MISSAITIVISKPAPIVCQIDGCTQRIPLGTAYRTLPSGYSCLLDISENVCLYHSIVAYFFRYINSFFGLAKKLSTHEKSYGHPGALMDPVIPFSFGIALLADLPLFTLLCYSVPVQKSFALHLTIHLFFTVSLRACTPTIQASKQEARVFRNITSLSRLLSRWRLPC